MAETARKDDMINNATPILNCSAIIPNVSASNDVRIVFNSDCAEITDVNTSPGELSAINPVKAGFLMFSAINIPVNVINAAIHSS